MHDWRDVEIEILRRYMSRVVALRDEATRAGKPITAEELNAAITPTAEEDRQLLDEMATAVELTESGINHR